VIAVLTQEIAHSGRPFTESGTLEWGVEDRAPCADTRPASANNPRSSWDFMLVERVGGTRER